MTTYRGPGNPSTVADPSGRSSKGAGAAPHAARSASPPRGPPTPMRDRFVGNVRQRDLRAQDVHGKALRDRLRDVGRNAGRGSAPASARIAPQDEIGEHPPLRRVEARVPAGPGREADDVGRELSLQERRGVAPGDREDVQRREIAGRGAVAGREQRRVGMCRVLERDRKASSGGRPCDQARRRVRNGGGRIAMLLNFVLKLNVSSPCRRFSGFPRGRRRERANSQTRAPQGARSAAGRQPPARSSHWRVVVQP